MRDNEEVVLCAVQQNGRALVFASNEMKNNQDVVLAAVRQNRFALQYVNEVMRNTITAML